MDSSEHVGGGEMANPPIQDLPGINTSTAILESNHHSESRCGVYDYTCPHPHPIHCHYPPVGENCLSVDEPPTFPAVVHLADTAAQLC